jgi:hypothetical protein
MSTENTGGKVVTIVQILDKGKQRISKQQQPNVYRRLYGGN